MSRAIAVYVSGHGFGHATRVAEVLRDWLERDPALVAHVRTTSPSWLFPEAEGRLRIRDGVTDVGLVQPDCLSIDYAGTLERLDALESAWQAREEAEAAWLRESGAELVLGDISPIAFAAAARAGVPSVALGNFSWDWIYRHYVARDERFAVHAERAADCYRRARRLLRLPFHGDMGVFSAVTDLPLVARRSSLPPREARRHLGLPQELPLVLLSFGGIGYPGLDAKRLGDIRGICFVTTDRLKGAPANVVSLAREPLDYVTLLAACDAVVTKPGWGIVAASLTNAVRVLCTWRADFPEAPILVRALEEHGTVAFVSPDELAQASFGAALEGLLARPVADARVASDGAARAVDALEAELGR